MIRLRFPIAWLNSMLAASLSPCSSCEGVVEAARLQPGRVQVRPPLGARLAERVLELDGLVAHGAERLQRARDVAGQLLAHAPELRADRDLLPAAAPARSTGARRARRPRRRRA